MKKSTQDNLDFDMIDLDETAGWNRLEIEAALTEQTDVEDNVFRGEITYEEDGFEEAEYHEADGYEAEYYEEDGYEAEYYEEVPVVVPKKKKTKTGKSSKTGKKSSKSSNTSKGAKGKTRKKSKRNETLWDKVAASFREMTLLDGVVAATGVIVLAVAVITVSVFSSAKAAERQVAAFAPIGEDMSYLVDAGRGTLIAMADSDHWVTALEEETEEETVDFEYEEKELEETKTVNVNMKLTSVQKDLKIKFVNYKTGKLISNVKFEVSITDANKKTREYTDDDKDGIIYLKDMAPGKATVTMLVLSGEEGYAFNTAPQTVKIKDKIEYTKIDVAEEVKSESEVNAAVEDTAKENEIEGELKDTVEWVASSKETVNSTDSYEKVDKGNIPNPADLVKAFVRMTESVVESSQQPSSEEPKQDPPKQEVEEPSSPQPSSEPEVQNPPKQDPTDSPSSQPSTEPSKQEPTEPSKQPTTEAPKPTTEAAKPSTEAQKPTTEATKPSTEPTTTTKPEETTTETTTPESTTTQPPASSTETKEDKAKKDTVTLLKDKSGNQMYLLNSSGNYVEAKYADYYGSNVTFYKKVTTSSYKYTGWQNIDGKTYFYTKDGEPVKGEQVIQGAKYTFGTDGALMTSSGTLGIDVSKWNGNIDWKAVKNSGISYVIIRCGYRGSTTGAMIEDPKFKTNIQGALNAGLKVGIYFFSQAVNEVEAVEEASMTIGLIKKYNISYPVFLDVEASGGRADGIDRNTRTQVIKAFCETIKNSGYTPGVYANKTWLNSYINAGEINSYKIWLAQYNTAPTYSGKFDMWQYSSKGQVSGISGHTDMNLSYMGY